MFKIIVVDDEPFSLKRFEYIAAKDPRLELMASFTDPYEAINFMKNNYIDIAFLDIEMPELNGLQLAERINEINSKINIIFVTAFDQYALDAFKTHALGYLLKPLDPNELSLLLDKISINQQVLLENTAPNIKGAKKFVIKCLGQFVCYSSDKPTEPVNFRTNKTSELFAFLIHHYKSPVSKFSILDSLFPDMDYEKSTKLFYVSCSYLRSTFSKYGISDILIRDNENYRINYSLIDCDYIDFMNYYERFNNLSLNELANAVSLCNGEYLYGRNYEWAFEFRTYIDSLYEKFYFKYADMYVKNNQTDEAISILERFLTLDSLRETTISKLLTLMVNSGQKDKAISLYRVYETKLQEQLDTIPSASVRAIINF